MESKRLCIYFLYDKEGVVDDYIPLYLKAIGNHFSEICVVVNGKLTKDGREKLITCCNKLIVRDNVGFDSWAYKDALFAYGLDYIAENYDEVLLNNFTCFGPIGSFTPMFEKMGKSHCDFWGHCRYYPNDGQRVRNIPVPEHLMSYFVLFRKTILVSEAWKRYWTTLQPVNDYDDARLHHEFRMTPYFERSGFISDAYIDINFSYAKKGINGSVYDAYEQLIVGKSPLLKRKVFFTDKDRYNFWASFSRYNYILYFIRRHQLYDMKFIFSNLIRTGNFAFSKNKLSHWRKFKYRILGDIFHMKKYSVKLAKYPDYKFIKTIMKD